MAERVGFEPTVPVKVQQFSRLPDSTTLAPLRELLMIKVGIGKYQAALISGPAYIKRRDRRERGENEIYLRVPRGLCVIFSTEKNPASVHGNPRRGHQT